MESGHESSADPHTRVLDFYAVSVTEDDFWRLIGLIKESETEPLVAALTRLDRDGIVGFHDHLVGAISVLDTPAHREQVVFEEGVDGDPIPPDSDEFDALRLAVVAEGRERWAAIVQDPTKLAGIWSLVVAEDLEFATSAAFEEATGDPWPMVSLARNDDPSEPASMTWPWPGWITLLAANHLWEGRLHHLPETYYEHLDWIQTQLVADRTWKDWWTAIAGPTVQLAVEIEYTYTDKQRTTIRAARDGGRDVIAVRAVVPALYPEGQYNQRQLRVYNLAWAARARQDSDHVLGKVAAKYKVSPPASLPEVAVMKAERIAAAQAEVRGSAAWWANRRETARQVAEIWRGRIPEVAIKALISEYGDAGRLTVLEDIAHLRREYQFPVLPDDHGRLAAAGYTDEQIAVALGDGASRG